jgi:hypothetical protein
MRVALILVGLGTLALMGLKTPPRSMTSVNEPPAQVTVGLRASYDTLTTADRIETKHTQFEALPQPVSSSELMPRADQTANVAQTPLKIIEQHRRSASAVKSALMLPRPRRGNGTSKAAANAGRDKPVAQVKPCRSGAFDGLFKTLNLSTRCQT